MIIGDLFLMAELEAEGVLAGSMESLGLKQSLPHLALMVRISWLDSGCRQPMG
jgi:hypothetical protein